MEPVVRGLRVDPLATRPLSQVHTPTLSLEHAYAVYHRLILEQFAPPASFRGRGRGSMRRDRIRSRRPRAGCRGTGGRRRSREGESSEESAPASARALTSPTTTGGADAMVVAAPRTTRCSMPSVSILTTPRGGKPAPHQTSSSVRTSTSRISATVALNSGSSDALVSTVAVGGGRYALPAPTPRRARLAGGGPAAQAGGSTVGSLRRGPRSQERARRSRRPPWTAPPRSVTSRDRCWRERPRRHQGTAGPAR